MLALLLLFALAQDDGQLVSRLPRVDGALPERVCAVHGEVMTVELVPMGYGLLSINTRDAYYWNVMQHEFPNARTRVNGGCMVGTQKQAEIYVCSKCQHARDRWLIEHPAFRPSV